MFFTRDSETDSLKKEIADLKEKCSRLSVEQDAHWKVLNSILQRLQSLPHGMNKDGSPRKKLGRPHKEEAA